MKTIILSLAVCSIASFTVFSCNKSEKTVPLQLLLTDAPATYESVNIHIVGMKVKMHKEDGSWISIDSKDTTVNLLDFQNGITTVIAQGNVPEGILKEVRFILGSGNTIVANGVTYNLDTPSAEHSGLKIKIDKKLGETLNTFTLDFDAALSIKEENGGYKLSPVIKVK